MLDEQLTQPIKQGRRRRLFEPLPQSVQFDRSAIERLLHHRQSMLLLDKITAVDLERRQIEATRYLKNDDPAFDGHFPGAPIYPGVLQVEMAGQLGLCLGAFLNQGVVDVSAKTRPANVRMFKIHHAQFVSELTAGDHVTVLSQVIDDNGTTMLCVGQLLVDERVVSISAVEAVIVGEDQ